VAHADGKCSRSPWQLHARRSSDPWLRRNRGKRVAARVNFPGRRAGRVQQSGSSEATPGRQPRATAMASERSLPADRARPTAPREQPAHLELDEPQVDAATREGQPARHENKAKTGRVDRRQRLRTLETEATRNCRFLANPTTNLWRRSTRSVYAGSPRKKRVPGMKRSRAQQVNARRRYLFRDVPAERRSSQASTTRLAMPASATLPQARGSYAFLLPTSPSTFSTPS